MFSYLGLRCHGSRCLVTCPVLIPRFGIQILEWSDVSDNLQHSFSKKIRAQAVNILEENSVRATQIMKYLELLLG